eukprot:1124589-Prymnesium_polylepis.2
MSNDQSDTAPPAAFNCGRLHWLDPTLLKKKRTAGKDCGKSPAGLRCLQSDANHATIRDRANAKCPGAAHYIPCA